MIEISFGDLKISSSSKNLSSGEGHIWHEHMIDNALCKYTGVKYNGEHKGQRNKVSLYGNLK